MNNKQIKQLKTMIESEEENFDLNDYIWNYINEEDLKDINDIYDLIEYLRDLNDDGDITNIDVIYYSNAITYLKENDPSLEESLELAQNMGYTDISSINSELLASLLKSENNLNDFNTIIENIEKREDELF